MGRFLRSTVFAISVSLSLGITPLAVATPVSHVQHSSEVSLTDIDSLIKDHGERSSQRVRVLIMLERQPAYASELGEADNKNRQAQLIAQWREKYELEPGRQLGFLVNGFSATMPASKIPALQREPEVASVKRERTYEKLEHNARKMEGVPRAHELFGLDGAGTVVSIIDSGIDPRHKDLQLSAQECDQAKLAPDTTHGSLFTCKVPAGYNFADDNYEIIDREESQHGQHVSGIVGANASIRDDIAQPDVLENSAFDGVAPKAQLLAMKVFPNNPDARANDSDIIAAIEASVKLRADIINMSLGSANGNRNDSDGVARAIAKAREAGVLVVVAAGNEGKNFSPNGELDNYSEQLDDGTLGSPAADSASFTVASIDNQVQVVPVANWRVGQDGQDQLLPHKSATGSADGQLYELVDLGYGQESDFTAEKKAELSGKFALIQRGKVTFADMFERAFSANAQGVLVYNDAARGEEFIGMGGIEHYTQFSASTYHSVGVQLVDELKTNKVYVKFTNERQLTDFGGTQTLRPSSFTSWGPTPTLDFSPHISGVGGEVYSLQNDDRYVSLSGTSMAAPNVAGLSALLWQHYAQQFPELSGVERTERIRAALMNTAQIPVNEAGIPFAPRQIGAGLARIDYAATSPVIATVNGLPYVSLREVQGQTSFTVSLHNYGQEDATYSIPAQQVLNESESDSGNAITVISSEQLSADVQTVTIPAGEERTVTFTLTPDTATSHFIEGWARFTGQNVPDIAVPYLGFVGSWNAEPIIEKPGVPWGDPVEHTAYTGLATLREGLVVPIGLLNDVLDDERDLTLWMSPNDDGLQDVIFPQLLVRRNAAEVEYEIESEDGTIRQTTGKQQDLRRYTLKAALGPNVTNDDIVENASGYGFDGQTYDPRNVAYTNVPDGRYIFKVKTRVSPEYDWQVTQLPFGIDTTTPTVTFGRYDEAEGYVYFTVNDSGSGIQVLPVVDTDSQTNLIAERVGDSDSEFRVAVPEHTKHIVVNAGDMAANVATAVHILNPQDKISVAFADDIQAGPIGPIKPYVTFLGEPDGPKLVVDGYVAQDVAKVTINGTETEIVDRNFYEYIPLVAGDNDIKIVAYNAAGEQVSALDLTPFYDALPPVLTIDSPAPISENTVTLTGSITDDNPQAQLVVLVDGVPATINENGEFSAVVEVSDDAQTVTVVASDGAQRISEAVPIAGRGADTPVPPPPPLPGGPVLPPPPPPLPDGGFPSTVSLPEITNAQCSEQIDICAVPTDTTNYDRETKVFQLKGTLNAELIAKLQLVPTGEAKDGKVVEPEPLVAQINPADGTFAIDIPARTGQNDFRLEIFVPGETADKPVKVKEHGFKLLIDVNVPEIHIDQPVTVGGSIFTATSEVVFSGKVSDDGWGYKFLINKDTVEERENNSGHGPQSNEREFTYPLKVEDGDKVLITVIDSFGNQILGVYPVVVDKEAPMLQTQYGEEALVESSVIADKEPIDVSATDLHLRSLKVELKDIDGTTISTQRLFTDINVTQRPIEDLMADVREIRDLAPDEEADADTALNAQLQGSQEDTPDEAAQEESPSVENEVFVSGTEANVVDQKLSVPIPTRDLRAGLYTLTVLADDFAGNVKTSAVTFVVDSLPLIEGPDTVDLTLTRLELTNFYLVSELIFAKFSIVDDGSADIKGDGSGSGEPRFLLDPSTVLVPGTNNVILRAIQPNGMETHKLLTVNITVKDDAPTPPGQDPDNDGATDTSTDGSNNGSGITDITNGKPGNAHSGSTLIPLANTASATHSGKLATTGSYSGYLILLAALLIAGGMVLNQRSRRL